MEVRVVCGLSATIASFCPIRALSSVDLPALGRPTMETNPERKFSLMGNGLRFDEAHLAYSQAVGSKDFDADAVAVDGLPGLGDAAEPFADKASDGGGLDVFFAMEGIDEVGHAVEIEIAGDDVAALAILDDVAGGLMLVTDFTDDDFE